MLLALGKWLVEECSQHRPAKGVGLSEIKVKEERVLSRVSLR